MFRFKSSPITTRAMQIAAAIAPILASTTNAEDSSPAPILQYFESRYNTIENRMPDVFKIGYGTIYTPPPGRADSGNGSVGYDQYDRFDLGYTGNSTLYGTETGIRKAVTETHKAGMNYCIDLVWNHNGFSTNGTSGFYDAGGYPGFSISQANDVDGDFHSPFNTNVYTERTSGLIDIAQEKSHSFIRSPVDPNDSRNIRAGTISAFGRLANVPTAANKRFYADTDGSYISVFDPTTGESNIKIYNYNSANPSTGDAVPENALGYLMRNVQWMTQVIGVDAYRVDAAKHFEPWVLNFLDRATYRQSQRTLLDGSKPNVFAFSEVFDTNTGLVRSYIRKDINPNDPGRIGGNRDALDFNLFYAMNNNLSGNGLQNDWRNINTDQLDMADDNLHNGSIGVKFVHSHDSTGAYLNNTAHAYTLMMPGQAVVYFNAQEFGAGRDFPKQGRGDALGGAHGNTISKLVQIRNVYAQGNYIQRHLTKESLAFERSKQSITLLSNRLDNTYENQKIYCNFAYGEYLVELTGNAAQYGAPQVLQVTNDTFNGPTYVNASFLPNNNGDHGYLVYGLQAPQGSMSFTGLSQTLAGTTPVLTGSNDNKAYQNATTRLSDLKVITGNSFQVQLATNAVNLLGSIRDRNADGDNALIKIDEGFDANGNGQVDYITPGNAAYGFEEFLTTKSPGYNNANGNGSYAQTINTVGLSEGYHYLTVRAFRRRTDGGPAVYQDWKETLYIDRLKPVSSVNAFKPFGTSAGDNDIWIKSDDQTADRVNVFINLPATMTEAQILALVNSNSGNTDKLDRDIFKTGFFGVPNGNNVFTIVTREITGNTNVQRITGVNPGSNSRGAGLGDLDHNGVINQNDIENTGASMEHFVYAQNAEFNPAGDYNADGLVDNRDLFAMESAIRSSSASNPIKTSMRNMVLRRGNINGQFGTDQYDIDTLFDRVGLATNNWYEDLDVDGSVTLADINTLVRNIFLTEFGDVNLDGKVSTADFVKLSNNYGNAGTWITGDFNGDNFVNFADYSILANHYGFGTTVSFAEIAAVQAFGQSLPEPTILSLSALVYPLLRRKRNSRINEGACI